MDSKTFEHVLGATMAFFAALLLTVCPGGLLVFFLPPWLGLPLAMGCGVGGALLLLKLSDDVNETSFLTAPVDTLPKGQDGEAGLVRSKGSAVPSEETAGAQRNP